MVEGKTLTGEGVEVKGGAGPDGEPAADAEGYKDIPIENVYSTMSNYAAKINELMNDATVKEKAAELMRDFVVLVAYTRFSTATNKLVTKFENVNVLVGPKAATDAVLPVVHSFMKGLGSDFVVTDRI